MILYGREYIHVHLFYAIQTVIHVLVTIYSITTLALRISKIIMLSKPGQFNTMDPSFDTESIFGGCGAIIFVIDAQVIVYTCIVIGDPVIIS
jgi:hypothetical protein